MTPSTPRSNGLFSLLRGYVFADEAEAAHLAHMHQLCESVADPFARTTFAPGHFTASAFVLSPSRDALLLIFHGKLLRWLQPGGHIEPGDADVLAAARREVHEEVGITDLTLEQTTPFDLDVHAIPATSREPAHAHFDLRFLFRAGSLAFRAGSDAKDARWVPLDEITAAHSDQSVMRAVAKLRRCGR
jgi:8-oxo-dGTP pyrophosphatase MutT (NUDIX family)